MGKKMTAIRFATLALIGGGICQSAYATNWFDIQTVSNPDWGYGKVIGFLEPSYTNFTTGTTLNGQTAYANLVPTTGDTTDLIMQRARLFVRGSLNQDISYYVGTEAGENPYTYSFGSYAPRIIDANVTFSHYIPGVRVNVGIIRAPGPEGAMDGFMSFNFLDLFPTVIGQMMQPTFYSKNVNYSTVSGAKFNPSGGYSVPGTDLSGNNGFRYPGVEAEDWFMVQPNLELAYGLMLADYGRQFESSTSNGPIAAGRLQLSYILNKDAKTKFFRNDITGFVWYQQARPEFNGISSPMVRDGLGATYRNGYMQPGATSLKAEYMGGTGNIEAPPIFGVAPTLTAGQDQSTFYPGSNNRAYGYDISSGLFVTNHVELNLRYDYYDRLPNLAAQERIFKNVDAAVEYHLTPLSRVVVDYAFRSVDIPNPSAIGKPGSPPLNFADSVIGSIGNEFNIYAIFAF